jgi:hypothetical protein
MSKPTNKKSKTKRPAGKLPRHPLLAQLDDLWKELRKAADDEHSEHLFIASHLVHNIAWNERVWNAAEKQLRGGLREDYVLLVRIIGETIDEARRRARSLPGPSYKRKLDHRFVAHALHRRVAGLRNESRSCSLTRTISTPSVSSTKGCAHWGPTRSG